MTAPAFVSAVPVGVTAFAPRQASPAAEVPARAGAATNASRTVAVSAPGVEFQTFSGGLDKVSMDPYSITRYLFKSRPSTLTEDEKDAAVSAGLRQVFGNAYLMEEERAELYVPESKFRCGEITAKEFVRACAKSSTYRKRFFESVSQFRFIELNFKHLLGRAPLNQVEYSKHFKIYSEGGFEAEIDSYLDGDDGEYDLVFGDDILPFTRFRGTYAPINQFNRMCTLEGGFAGSDKFKPQQLVTSLALNIPTKPHTIVDGLPPIPNAEHPSLKYGLPTASLERFRNEVEVAKAKALEVSVSLQKDYANLAKARATIDPFKAMVSDMDITPLYGKNYGDGVEVFSGQYIGAPAGGFGGSSGVGNIAGPSRGAAKAIAKKEKQLEGLKQLVVDLERKVEIMEGALDAPALQPEPVDFFLDGIEVPEFAAQTAVAEEEAAEEEEIFAGTGTVDVGEGAFDDGALIVGGTAVVGGSTVVGTAPVIVGGKQLAGTGTATDARVTVRLADPEAVGSLASEDDEDADSDGVFTASAVVISTQRRADDDLLGPNPKELIEEMEEERIASGKDFLAGSYEKPTFPGDGSEMNIGG